MKIEKVYCKELDRNIDIYEANLEYFKQTEPREDFSFYCSDPECQKAKNPRVTGVLYNAHPNKETRRAPHFRKWDEHIDTCMWKEISESLDEIDSDYIDTDEKREYLSKLKRTDVVEIFQTIKKDKMTENQENSIHEEKLREIQQIESKEERKEEYKKLYSDAKISTLLLHKIVSSYHLLEERHLLEYVDLKVDKTIMKYRDWFKHIKFYNDNYRDRIFYGGATVSKFKDIGYTISFFDKNESNNTSYSNKNLYLFIKINDINSYKYAPILLDILEKSVNHNKWVKCFFIGNILINENGNLKANVSDLNHLHLIFK